MTRIEDYTLLMKEFIQALGLTGAVVMGHSMGGAIALSLALHQPVVCSRIILLNSAAKFTVPSPILAELDGEPTTLVDLICQCAFTPYTSPNVPVLKEATRRIMLKLAPGVLRGDFLACQAFDVVDRLRDVQLPTLVLGAERDVMTPLSDAQLLAERIPDATFVVLSNAGHMVPLVQPELVREAVLAFLSLDKFLGMGL